MTKGEKWRRAVEDFKIVWRNKYGDFRPWENAVMGAAVHPVTGRLFRFHRKSKDGAGEPFWSRR